MKIVLDDQVTERSVRAGFEEGAGLDRQVPDAAPRAGARLLQDQSCREGRERCSIPQPFARRRILLDPHGEGNVEIQWHGDGGKSGRSGRQTGRARNRYATHCRPRRAAPNTRHGGLARPGPSLQGHHSEPRLQGTPTERVRVGSNRSRRVPDYARGILPPLRPRIQEDEGWRVGPVEEPRPQPDTREVIILGSHVTTDGLTMMGVLLSSLAWSLQFEAHFGARVYINSICG